jgi:nitrogen regulatory protein PII-like uncharacterized protein
MEKWLNNTEARKKVLVSHINSKIQNECVKDFTLKSLEKAPDYFWERPSSTTGKWHPKDEFVKGGLVLHVVKSIKLAQSILRGMSPEDWANFSSKYLPGANIEFLEDCFYSAIILHDLFSSGFSNQIYKKNGEISTDPMHAVYPRQALKTIEVKIAQNYNVKKTAEECDWFNVIMILIEGHYGKWSCLPQIKPKDIPSWNLYMVDYIASRNFVQIELDEEDINMD